MTATLLGGDVDGDDEPDVLPLTEQQVAFTVVQYQNSGNRQLDCGTGALGGGNERPDDGGTVATGQNGEAVLTYTGPADPDPANEGDELYDCIIAEWEGSGAYAGQGPHETTATKDWLDGEGVPSSLDLRPDEAVKPRRHEPHREGHGDRPVR